MTTATGRRPTQKYDRWWLDSEEDHRAESVFAAVAYLDQQQDYRRNANLHHMRLYSNRMASGLSGYEYAVSDHGERIRINVIKSVIDAATAQISTSRPKPMFMTTGGDHEARKRAGRLNRFMTGQFYALDQYEISLRVFLDACIFGTGFEYVYADERGKIVAERVFPDEIIVDDVEARDGSPRTLYRHKEIDKAVAAQRWPKHENAILDASFIRDDGGSRNRESDKLSLVEAFHLPAGEDSGDGLRVLCIDSEVIDESPWVRDDFPFPSFRWSLSPLGYYGLGVAEELTSIQIEINYLTGKIQNLMNLATTQIWARRGEGIQDMDNEDMGTKYYKNTPPVVLNTMPVHQQIIAYVWELYTKAYEVVGVSQMSAQSQVPQNLKSGTAIMRATEIGSRRFQHVGQNWERFHLDVGEAVMECAREIEARGDGSVKVLAQNDKGIEEITFSEVSIEKDKYITRVYPVALLPDTPQGKIEAISELSQAIPEIGAQVLGLMTGIPDLEAVVKRHNAPRDLIESQIDSILSQGEPQVPYPYQDLNLLRQEATMALNQGHEDGVSENRLELLRRYIDRADEMAEIGQPPVPMGPPEAPGPQPGPGPAVAEQMALVPPQASTA